MTNFQVYRKTLSFSLLMFAIDILKLLVVGGCGTLGFVIFNSFSDMAILGLVIGIFVGIIAVVFISIFVSNRIKAAH